ncbi:hypothetical protein [Amycolatopsis samaneae]|uniref:hypothetical protein n=1 Tax=Amycolatopsis samaneae TaxID=664691 RepID=UPI003CD05AC1
MGPVVIKAQVETGGRGKRAGVRFARTVGDILMWTARGTPPTGSSSPGRARSPRSTTARFSSLVPSARSPRWHRPRWWPPGSPWSSVTRRCAASSSTSSAASPPAPR